MNSTKCVICSLYFHAYLVVKRPGAACPENSFVMMAITTKSDLHCHMTESLDLRPGRKKVIVIPKDLPCMVNGTSTQSLTNGIEGQGSRQAADVSCLNLQIVVMPGYYGIEAIHPALVTRALNVFGKCWNFLAPCCTGSMWMWIKYNFKSVPKSYSVPISTLRVQLCCNTCSKESFSPSDTYSFQEARKKRTKKTLIHFSNCSPHLCTQHIQSTT